MALPKRTSAAGWAACAALWAVVVLYAWNHRVFLSQAAPLFR